MEYDVLQALAVDLTLTIIKSVNYERIRPLDLWPRIQNALRGAAIRGQTFGDMIAIMGQKLLIDTYIENTSISIHKIGEEVNKHGFEKFRDICEREALYIVAEAQALKALRKKKNGKN